MTVIALPEKHQQQTRIRTAMHKLISSLDEQAVAIQHFRQKLETLDGTVKKIDGSFEEYTGKLAKAKQGCEKTPAILSDALAAHT